MIFHILSKDLKRRKTMNAILLVFVIIAAVIDQPVHALVHVVIADRCQMTAHGFAELLRVFHGIADIGEYMIVMSFIFDGFFRNKRTCRILCVINHAGRFGSIRRMYNLCY